MKMRTIIVALALSLLAVRADATAPTSKNMVWPNRVMRIDSNGAVYSAACFQHWTYGSNYALNPWLLSGSEVIRFEVRSGDLFANGERSELDYLPVFNQGQTTNFSFDVYFDPSNTVLTGANYWNVFAQFHPNANTGSPNVAFQIDNSTGTNLQMVVVSGVVGGTTTWSWTNIATYVTGTWFNLTGQIKWSTGVDGFVTVSVNGGANQTFSGPTLYWTDNTHTVPLGVYPKQGIYRAAPPIWPSGFAPSIWYMTIMKLY